MVDRTRDYRQPVLNPEYGISEASCVFEGIAQLHP